MTGRRNRQTQRKLKRRQQHAERLHVERNQPPVLRSSTNQAPTDQASTNQAPTGSQASPQRNYLQCFICYEDAVEKGAILLDMQCGHMMCAECVEVLRDTAKKQGKVVECPVCGRKLSKQLAVKLRV